MSERTIMATKKRRKLVAPKRQPKPGFYYHYKHDPNGSFDNYAYLVFGVGCHTEDDCRPIDRFQVGYRPLYESAAVYQAGKGFFYDTRPLSMFLEKVRVNEKWVPRFTLITDEKLIKKLKKKHDQMYERI